MIATKYDKKSIHGCFIVHTTSQRKQYSIRDIYTHLAQFDIRYEFIYIYICSTYIYMYIYISSYINIQLLIIYKCTMIC